MAAVNLKWVSTNPNPASICPMCAPMIGVVFDPEDADDLMLPLHPFCYCMFIPTDEPPTEFEWPTLDLSTLKTIIYRIAYLLRIGLDIPKVWEFLREKAEEYNRKREEEDDENDPQEDLMPQSQTFSGHVHLAPQQPNRNRREYDCILIQPGKVVREDQTESDWLIPAAVLREAAPLFDAVPSYLDHPELFGFGWHQHPQVKHLSGIFANVTWDETQQAITGTLRLYDQHPNSAGAVLGALLDQILADKDAGLEVPPVGLSAVFFQSSHVDEETGLRVTDGISYVESVDVVYSPGARGYIQRAVSALAAQPADQWQGITVLSPLAQGANTMDNVTLDTVAATQSAAPPQAPPALSPDERQQITRLNAQVDAILTRLGAQADAATVKDNGPGHTYLYGGRSGLDQVELAVEALFNGTRPPRDVRPLSGIRELYTLLSGDFELTGVFREDRVYLANVTSTTMANLVANVLNKRVVNLYATFPKWWEGGVSEQDFNSLQQIRWITLGGVGEQPTVAEGAAYTELTWDDLAQRTSFAKKGGYLGITLEAIDKDDTGRVIAAPRALAQAAWLTLGKAIAEIFSYNSGVGPNVYYDDSNQRALFHSSNSNLGSTALSAAAYEATKIAMMKQTELGSSERLGALARPKNLWVPIDLENTALKILASEGYPGTANNDINPDSEGNSHDALLANARQRLIVVPFWTDTNDWAAQADPMLWPTIGVGYRYGREPEIFSVADPKAGLMFTNDTMPVKVRFFFAAGPMTYTGLYKHNVT